MALVIRQGQLESLRVNERGDRFGGSGDNITAEVIVQLAGDDGAYGFRLLDDEDRPLRQGYLDLLRDALAYGHNVRLDVEIDEGKTKGIIIRLTLEAQPDQPGPASPRLRDAVVTRDHR
ncbi:hypothetical protein [Marinobacter sp. OP 3.4]|uniref:hypothetical protein n=1 Tax=Marinobacter sp. OP 3.4 TaxID=3076501 RepID=UPI002E24C679